MAGLARIVIPGTPYHVTQRGNRTGVSFANGVTQAFGYDPVSRLASLSNNLTDTNDLSATFAYNPASQVIQTVRTGDMYAFTSHPSQTKAGVANGLNQLTSIGGAATAHDARGNLTTDPTTGKGYGYSSENLLKTATGGVTASYDPLLRLYQVAGAATTRFAYDGLDAIAEYNGAGSLLRRFVFDPTNGQPVVWYEGTGTAAANRRYLSSDERGSIISVSSSAGASLGLNSYDEYGKPGASNIGRFQYTGQAWIPELGLYYYKARFYAPHLGRFMQTDPISYADSPNLYAYVLGDPVNLVDPLGRNIEVPPRGSICNNVNTCDLYGSTLGLLLRRDAAIGGSFSGAGGGGINCVSTPGSVSPGSGDGPVIITGGSTTCTSGPVDYSPLISGPTFGSVQLAANEPWVLKGGKYVPNPNYSDVCANNVLKKSALAIGADLLGLIPGETTAATATRFGAAGFSGAVSAWRGDAVGAGLGYGGILRELFGPGVANVAKGIPLAGTAISGISLYRDLKGFVRDFAACGS